MKTTLRTALVLTAAAAASIGLAACGSSTSTAPTLEPTAPASASAEAAPAPVPTAPAPSTCPEFAMTAAHMATDWQYLNLNLGTTNDEAPTLADLTAGVAAMQDLAPTCAPEAAGSHRRVRGHRGGDPAGVHHAADRRRRPEGGRRSRGDAADRRADVRRPGHVGLRLAVGGVEAAAVRPCGEAGPRQLHARLAVSSPHPDSDASRISWRTPHIVREVRHARPPHCPRRRVPRRAGGARPARSRAGRRRQPVGQPGERGVGQRLPHEDDHHRRGLHRGHVRRRRRVPGRHGEGGRGVRIRVHSRTRRRRLADGDARPVRPIDLHRDDHHSQGEPGRPRHRGLLLLHLHGRRVRHAGGDGTVDPARGRHG